MTLSKVLSAHTDSTESQARKNIVQECHFIYTTLSVISKDPFKKLK
jgi:hypothetical protein